VKGVQKMDFFNQTTVGSSLDQDDLDSRQNTQNTQNTHKKNKISNFEFDMDQLMGGGQQSVMSVLDSIKTEAEAPRQILSPPQKVDCEHVWSYVDKSSERECKKCHITGTCPHETMTFQMGHRTCTDCNIVPFGMKIERSPPNHVVYNRNIKADKNQLTAPLILVGMDANDHFNWKGVIRDFTVSVSLIEDKTFEPLVDGLLKGTSKYTFGFDRMEQDGGQEILFKCLKILSTSKQKKNLKNGTEIKDHDFILQWSFYANKCDAKATPILVAVLL
jgi:hypothetical protein